MSRRLAGADRERECGSRSLSTRRQYVSKMRYEESSLLASLVQLILFPKVYRMTGLITDYPGIGSKGLRNVRGDTPPPGGGSASVQRGSGRRRPGPRRLPAGPGFTRRRGRLGLAGDDVSLDQPLERAGARLESLREPRRRGLAPRHLPRSHRRSVRRRLPARRRRQAVRCGLHSRVCDRLCELVRRLLGVSRRGHPRRSSQVRRLVVAQAHQRGRLHCRASRRPRDRERLPGFRLWRSRSGRQWAPARSMRRSAKPMACA